MRLLGLLLIYCLIPVTFAARITSNAWLLELEIPKELREELLANDIHKNHRGPFVVPEKYLVKVPTIDLDELLNMFHEYRRSIVNVARVESGHGAIKTELVTYPPNYLQARLKRLLYLKQKNEANKNLNAT